MSHYKEWKLETDSENIIWLGMDRHDAAINTINDAVLDELNLILQEIASNHVAIGLILYSCKSKGFVAGADVNTFTDLQNASHVADFLRKGQAVFARLEALKIPTVAMIDGFCMGGGLELALACRYRVATDSPDTSLGLPEVLLGIHPGWGGTVRLPRLIGGFDALSQVMLTGNALRAKKAKKLGFVDDVVPLRQLKRAAVYYIKNKPEPHKPRFLQSITQHAWARMLLAKVMRHALVKKVAKAHYPAPYAMVDLWEKEAGFDDRAYLKEADSIEQLITPHGTAVELMRVFFLRERLKKIAKESDFSATHVHVIGAGVMGGDIAAWCALRGLRVTLQDQTHAQLASAISRAHALFTKKLRDPRLIRAVMDRLIPDPSGYGIQRADVIIEAVFENLDIKQTIIKRVEQEAKPTAIIATNTSSIPLDEINRAMRKPQRLVGIHFFNPVAKMILVEVVSSAKTRSNIVQDACAFVGQIGRIPLPVQSSPGFLVNRVLMPYLLECMKLLEEGYGPEEIDHAAESFGMMMGPVELADTVGMDVCLAVAENLTSHFGGVVPEKLRERVASGLLGRKTGEGFYRYRRGKPIKRKINHETHDKEIADRLILCLIQEAKTCLQEGVVADADLLDAGMIFATGFAPFRGGPLQYATRLGR